MSQLENYKLSRWVHRFHSTIQFILVVTLFLGLNILSLTHFKRYDITEDRRYALSPETISYIQELDEKVRIIVTESADLNDPELRTRYLDIKNLVKEYEYIAKIHGAGPIEPEYINVYQQRRLAQELVDEFGVSQPNLIIFASEGKHRAIELDELYESEGLEKTAFRGEQVFTSALLDVTSPKGNTIYFLEGHGERDIQSVDPIAGLSQLAQQLEQRNFELRTLNLTGADARVPDDADLLVLAGPRQPLLAREVTILKDYLNDKAGRLIVMIDPAVNNNLGDLFYQWGVLAEDMLVLDRGPDYNMNGGDLLLRRFDPDHPITKSFAANSLSVLVGLSRPVRMDIGAPVDDRLYVNPIVGGSGTSWGERFYRDETQIGYQENVDLPGPVSVVVVSERSISSDLGIDIPGGRLVVFGTSELITNNRLKVLGNFTLFLNTLNWALNRNNLLAISPKPIEKLHITLSQEEMNKLQLAILLIMPGCSILFGTFVYWLRRN
ncbi:MAG: ABC transporter [Opitutaceae bacterium]|nr:ABC transporter [Opitutaceae bacterium]